MLPVVDVLLYLAPKIVLIIPKNEAGKDLAHDFPYVFSTALGLVYIFRERKYLGTFYQAQLLFPKKRVAVGLPWFSFEVSTPLCQ